MPLSDVLTERREPILRRWSDAVLATYPAASVPFFGRQTDPFANPVGHSVRTGTRALFDALLEGGDPEGCRAALHSILSIRAVQQFAPSGAVGFVTTLKSAIRSEIADVPGDPGASADLARLDAWIDGLLLVAFDVFVECRERVYELRVAELRRMTSWATDHAARTAARAEPVESAAPAGAGEGGAR